MAFRAKGAVFSNDVTNESGLTGDTVTEALDESFALSGDIRRTKAGSAPSTPADGDEWYHTTDRVLYRYDSSRSKWLGDLEFFDLGRQANLTGASTERMLGPGGLITDRTDSTVGAGWWTPYESTVTGVTIQMRGSSSPGTTSFVLYATDPGSGYTAISTVVPGAVTYSDQTLDLDFAEDRYMSGYIILGAAETANFPRVRWYYRRKG